MRNYSFINKFVVKGKGTKLKAMFAKSKLELCLRNMNFKSKSFYTFKLPHLMYFFNSVP